MLGCNLQYGRYRNSVHSIIFCEMSDIYLHVHHVLWPIDTTQNTVSPYSFIAFKNDLHIQGKLSMGVQMCSFITYKTR